MKYLSIDLEATGLEQDCLIIEFAMVPFDTETATIAKNLGYETLVKCPTYDSLLPGLNPWVAEHNKELIINASKNGIELSQLKSKLTDYFNSAEVKSYFNDEKIVLFGKSMNAIDLPFLNRDLGWDFMREYFSHRQLDFSSVCYHAIDSGLLAPGEESGSALMKRFNMGEVAHTALADAENTAIMYLKLLEMQKN